MTATDPTPPAPPADAPAPLPAAEATPAEPVSAHSELEAASTDDRAELGADAAPEAAAPRLSPEACAAELKARFPALFAGAAKPVKLRIQADIQARAPGVFTRATLSGFLRRHTGSTSYLIALTQAPQRLDLDGQPAGEISAEHRQAAADELARRRALRDSRRQADEAARRDRALLLRAFETTTLTRENFCALKGIAPDALDTVLAQARQEATEARQAREQGPGGHRPGGPGPRRDGPGPRRDGPRREGGGPRREGQGPRPDGGAPRPPRRGR
ncbi:ProQ/FINO family protein [Ideonella sp.]|uniref:ProQ/FINO family protein n=1 Tax=Ideonella sp. TaxID=1929293 RepID=UPI0035B483CB